MLVMTMNGVLRDPNNGGIIPTGNVLYRALTEFSNLALIAWTDDADRVNHWLAVNNLTEHSYLVLPRLGDPEDAGQTRVRQIIRLKESGSVEGLFEPDPAVAETVLQHGTPVFLAVSPAYSQPEFLPGYKALPTPWSSLVDEIARQQDLKAADSRLSQELV